MRHVVGLAGVALVTALGACAPGAGKAPAEPVAAAPATPTFQRAAYAGTKQRMDFLTTLSPDCAYMGPSTYHFTARPQHGAIDVKPSREAPAYTQNNIHYKCNDRRVPGMMLYYTPERGFTGTDRFTMEWISPAGLFYRRQYEVMVR